MGFFDEAERMLDKGVSVAKGTVSGVAVEQRGFMKGFVRLCFDGAAQGWHERNGGNATYRMLPEEVAACRSFFYDTPSSWVALGASSANMAGEFLVVTAAGSHMRNVSLDVTHLVGIVEINATGDAWRIVWGLKDGGVPTSELSSHVACHGVRKEVSGGVDRVLYHAHPTNLVALTCVLPLDSRTFTRTLWKAHMESMVAFPHGLGVVPWTAPGGLELATATAAALRGHDACVWAHHGLFAAGADFDAVFGLVQTAEKAASVYLAARAANGGSDAFLNEIPDAGLREIAMAYHLSANEAYL